jgi:predicted dehydrogenase
MGSLHARVVTESPRAELAWIADPSREVGEAVATRFGTRWIPAMDLSSVDGVIIAAATEAHPDLAFEVLDARLPLLVEKPLADRLHDARRIVERSAELDLPLMCGFLERYNPAIRTALDFLERPIHATAVRHSPYVPRIRTGVASDLLIHDLDTMIRLFGGMPESVAARLGYFHPSSRPGSEDVAEVILHFPGGSVGAASASRVTQRKVRTLVVQELERQVELDLVRQDITVYRHVGNSAADDLTGLGYSQQTVIDIPFVRHQREPLATQLDLFLDLLDGIGDVEAERRSLLPAHELLETVRTSLPTT